MPAVILPDYPIIRDLHLGTHAHLSGSMAAWRSVASIRGPGFREAPHVAGATPRQLERGPIRFLHEVLVDGHTDPDGDPYDDPAEGLDANLELLYAACAPNTSSPYTFPVTHVRPHGNRIAQITVVDITTPTDGGVHEVLVGLDIVIPAGVFEDEEDDD